MKLNPIPQRNSTNRASIILYNNAKSFTISFMKFSVYEWSVAHATDYNLTRVIGLELRVEGKKRGCFHLDCRKEMPNCWTPIDRSTRANEPYAITGRAKSATLRNLQVASTPRRKHGCTKRRCLIYYIGFLSRSNDSWKKKKGKRKRMWDFCNDSIHLSLLFFCFFHGWITSSFRVTLFQSARSPLWNSSRFSELIYLPAGFRLLYVSRLYANRDSIVMYQLIEIPVHIIRTRAAVNSDRWSNNSERVLPWSHFESWLEGN